MSAWEAHGKTRPSCSLPFIDHGLCPDPPSPTVGSAHLYHCSLLRNCQLIEAPECRTAVCFLNYARLDLLLGKYLACLSPVVRSAVKSCYHIASHSSDVCSCNEAGTDNLQASIRAAERSLESPRSSQFSQNNHNSKPSRNTHDVPSAL